MIRILFLLCFWPVIAFAQQPGDLDSSFAVNGKLVLEEFGSVRDIAVQQDGGILILTYSGSINNTRIIRLYPTGEQDTSFANSGEFIHPGILRILLQSDGKLLLVTSGGVLRLLHNGVLDTTYTSPIIEMIINDAKTYPNDALLLAGVHQNGRRLYRLNIDGTMDSTFGIGGQVTHTSTFYGDLLINGLEISVNGSIYYLYKWSYVSPPSPSGANVLVHLDATGQQLATFPLNVDPWVQYYTCPKSLVLNANGCLLSTYDRCGQLPYSLIIRYGLIYDNIFLHQGIDLYLPYSVGSIGRCTSDAQGNFFIPFAMGFTDAFNIVSVISCTNAPWSEWGDQGWVSTSFAPYSNSIAEMVVVQPDGKILAGGSVSYPEKFALARYHNIPDPRSKLRLKMFLGGPYDPATGLMSDHLRQQGQIPFIQPYQPPAFQPKNGVGTWGLGAGVLDLQGDSAIVDWVWLELLDPDSLTHVKATRVGLLHRNGQVTAADGHSPIDFSVGAGNYMLRVRHRNHLSVTLSDPITLGLDPIEVDLTSPATATFGTDAQKEADGVMVLWPGDASGNGMVNYVGSGNDRDRVLIKVGSSTPTNVVAGYFKEDIDLDGSVKYTGSGNDRDVILQTIGGNVPTAVRVEQGP